MTHRHHIVPKHAGGSNEESNIVVLTIPEHAEAHRLLFEQHGKLEDKVAWLALSGQTEKAEEARRELTSQYMRNRVVSEKTRRRMSEAAKLRHRADPTLAKRMRAKSTGFTGKRCTENQIEHANVSRGRTLQNNPDLRLKMSAGGQKSGIGSRAMMGARARWSK